jgi:hypothetical protein
LSFAGDAVSGQTNEDVNDDLLHDLFELLLKSCDESDFDGEGVDTQAESVKQPYQVQLDGDQDVNEQCNAFLEMFDEKVRQRKTRTQSTASTSFAPELDNAEDESTVQPQESGHIRIVSLKEWIRGSLGLIQKVSNSRRKAIASSTYLTAALQIGIALSERINARASDIKADRDWAGNVRIRLQPNTHRKLPFSSFDNVSTLDVDAFFETLLSRDERYFSIDSARITGIDCETSQLNRQSTTKSMYYLGLVFYVLFSGGESPPADLSALSSLDGAFVSLSTLSLVKQDDNEDEMTPRHIEDEQGCWGLSNV